MASDLFEIKRKDGRSSAQVLIDHVKIAPPGHLFPYEELCEVLSNGSDHAFSMAAIRGVVARASRRLLREHQRALENVLRVGYRVALASEHTRLAVTRSHKADLQMKRGMALLKHVRWDELDPNARMAHEGTLMIMNAFHEQQSAFDRRLRNLERAFASVGLKATEE
jgi:hypothetical protein